MLTILAWNINLDSLMQFYVWEFEYLKKKNDEEALSVLFVETFSIQIQRNPINYILNLQKLLDTYIMIVEGFLCFYI